MEFIVFQEIIRIKNEHPDDSQCIVNDRVKGRLKVTRAFGAGFLKQVPSNSLLVILCIFFKSSIFQCKHTVMSIYISTERDVLLLMNLVFCCSNFILIIN